MEEILRLVRAMPDDELVAAYRAAVTDFPPEFVGVHLPARIGILLDADVLAARPFLELVLVFERAFRTRGALDGFEMARAFRTLSFLARGRPHPDGLAATAAALHNKLT
jgi:hypothetical protein